jgi:KaiC/GvpD/RAD55 family RecA-like ATPase
MTKTILYVMPGGDYLKNLLSLLKKEAKSEKVIYISANRPFSNLIDILKEGTFDTKKFFFIDCVSKKAGVTEEPDNVFLLDSPQHVTGMSIAITKAVDNLPGEKMLFFDSLSTMLIYNSEDVVAKFSNFIINKMRIQNVSTIMLILDADKDKKTINIISTFVDEVRTWQPN